MYDMDTSLIFSNSNHSLIFVTQETHESSLSQPQGPLPDPSFILSNQPVQRPTPLTTSTVAGRAALSKKRSSTSQKTSSKKTKTSTGKSSKKASQVQEEGRGDVV
jgi:hypothetical protein